MISYSIIKIFFSVIFFNFTVIVFCQVNFERGYIIDKNDARIECLIKNFDWRENPNKILYKLSSSDSEIIATAAEIKEFEVYGFFKYISETVRIDRSSTDLSFLSRSKQPEWSIETLFLRVLVESRISLFEYIDKDLVRFFYRKDSAPIEQLIWKEYLNEQQNHVGVNSSFKQQLWTNLLCEKIKQNEIENLSYRRRSLMDYFLKVNDCIGENVVKARIIERKTTVNLRVVMGANLSFLRIIKDFQYTPSVEVNSKAKIGIVTGLGIEAIMPFSNGSFSFIFEPTYQNYKSGPNFVAPHYEDVRVDLSFIDLPIGLRYYRTLNRNTKFFLNGYFVTPIRLDNKQTIYDQLYNVKFVDSKLRISSTFSIGAGTEIKKWNAELRYQLGQSILPTPLDLGYKRLSFLVSYKIFSNSRKPS